MARDIKTRITLDGTEFLTSVQKAGRAVEQFQKKLRTIGQGAAIAGAALAGPFLVLGRSVLTASIDFESAFAGVRKTVTASEAEFQQLSDNFTDLSERIPVARTELAKIGEIAGQLGVRGVANLTKFTDTIARIAVSTNLTTDQAATNFARLANVMGVPLEEVDRLGSAIVAAGNNFATTEGEISEFAQRLASAGRTVGASVDEVIGLATALSAVGVNAEAGGTSFSKLLIELSAAARKGGDEARAFAGVIGLTVEQFQALQRTDPSDTLVRFIESLGRIRTAGGDVIGTLDQLGIKEVRLRNAVLSAANAGGLFRQSLETTSAAFKENTALTEESEKRFVTLASQLAILQNLVTNLASVFGDALGGGLRRVINVVKPLIAEFKQFLIANEALVQGLTATAAVMAIGGTLLAGVGAFAFIIGSLGAAGGAIALAITALAVLVGGLTTLIGSLSSTETSTEEMGKAMDRLGATFANFSPDAADAADAVKEVGESAVESGHGVSLLDRLLRNLAHTEVIVSAGIQEIVEGFKLLKNLLLPGLPGIDTLKGHVEEFKKAMAEISAASLEARRNIEFPEVARRHVIGPAPEALTPQAVAPKDAAAPLPPITNFTKGPNPRLVDLSRFMTGQQVFGPTENVPERGGPIFENARPLQKFVAELENARRERLTPNLVAIQQDIDNFQKALRDKELTGSRDVLGIANLEKNLVQAQAVLERAKAELTFDDVLGKDVLGPKTAEQTREFKTTLSMITDVETQKIKDIDASGRLFADRMLDLQAKLEVARVTGDTAGERVINTAQAQQRLLIEEQLRLNTLPTLTATQDARNQVIGARLKELRETIDAENGKLQEALGQVFQENDLRHKRFADQAFQTKQAVQQSHIEVLQTQNTTATPRNFEIAQAQIQLLQSEFQKISTMDIIGPEQESRLSVLAVKMQELNKVTKDISPIWLEIRDTLKGAMRDMVRGVLQGTQSMKDLFSRLLDNIAAAFIEKGISKFIDQIFTAASATSGGGVLGRLFGFAGGGVMTPRGPLQLRAFAGGGVATRPTMAIFGEGSGSEAFVPLPDGRRIPVALQGAVGGGTVVNVINQTGESSTEERRRGPHGTEEIFITIGKKMADQVRRRGPLGQAMEQAFGLKLAPGGR